MSFRARARVIAAGAVALVVCAALVGCKGQGNKATLDPQGATRVLPSYSEIAKRHNERIERLGRVWCRAVVSLTFRGVNDEPRWEQGEGHFQFISPSQFALSAGKLGEVIAWIGCDEDRYWLIDTKEQKKAFVGRYDQVDIDKLNRVGLPAAPRDLIRMTGLMELPAAKPGVVYGWSDDGRDVIVEETVEGRVWRYTMEPDGASLRRIELVDEIDRQILVSAELEDYAPVSLRGVGGHFPLMASRVTVRSAVTGSEVRVTLSGQNDGGGSRLSAENFDFTAVCRALGVSEVVDLDAQDGRVEAR